MEKREGDNINDTDMNMDININIYRYSSAKTENKVAAKTNKAKSRSFEKDF